MREHTYRGVKCNSVDVCEHATCPRQEVSGNTSSEFVIGTDFLPYILRIPVSGYFLPGTS